MEVKLNAGVLKRGKICHSLNKEKVQEILNCATYRDIKKHFNNEIVKDFLKYEPTISESVALNIADKDNRIIFIMWTNRGCFYTGKMIITDSKYS